ncbi:MAG TPA: hypothetical protein VGF55_28080 [Gemmataceae bacterium]|jgi:hypothetical protein
MYRSRRCWVGTWFARWLAPARTVRRDSTRLRLLPLEDRTVPSTYTVTGTGDTGTGTGTAGDLRYCLTQANSNSGADTIQFSSTTAGGATNFHDGSAHTITLTSALPTITGAVTVTGAGAALTIINANAVGRVFDIQDTGSVAFAVTFAGLTMKGGSAGGAGGGIRFQGSTTADDTLTIQNSTISGNAAGGGPDAAGGGVYFDGGGNSGDALSITGSTVTGNVALAATDGGGVGGKAFGGGVCAINASVTVSNSTVEYNRAQGGVSHAAPHDATSAAAYGGGLYVNGATTLTVTGSTLSGNTAAGGDGTADGGVGGKAFGGSMYVTNAYAAVSNSVVTYNFARGGDTKALPYDGSGVFAHGGGVDAEGEVSLTVTGGTIAHNTAQGGQVVVTDTLPEFSTLHAGPGDGGGLFFHSTLGDTESSTLLFSMTAAEVDTNLAVGGAMSDDFDTADIFGGPGVGGGMDVVTTEGQAGAITAQGQALDSTFAGNVAQGGTAIVRNIDINGVTTSTATGGNAFAGGAAVARLINSTLYANTAAGGHAEAYRLDPEPDTPDPLSAHGGTAGGGGFGPGFGAPYGYLFDYTGADYTIAHGTIVGNAAVRGTSFDTPDALSFAGGVDDGDPDVNYGTSPPSMVYDTNVGLYSTIVAGNTATAAGVEPTPDIVGGFSDGHNLIGYYSGHSAPNFPQGPFVSSQYPDPNGFGDIVGPDNVGNPLDPGLSTFGYHGGLTQTLVPQSGGLALDNGEDANLGGAISSLTYDQREAPFLRTIDQTNSGSENYSDGTDVGAAEGGAGVVYADRRWATLTSGDAITDADPVATGDQPAVFGYNAFATVTDAITAAETLFASNPAGGEVIVNGYDGSTSGTGVFSENVDDDIATPVILQYGAISVTSLTIESGAAVEVTATLGATAGAGIAVSVGGLTSYGALTLDPGSSSTPTTLTNTGSSQMYFGDGSVTKIASVATAGLYAAWLDLHGHDAFVTGTASPNPGALFVNNGVVYDSTNSTSPAPELIADHHARIKGAGTYGVSVVTQNGAVFQAGNSPGRDAVDSLVLGPGGVSDFVFCIDNATGTAGPTPDADGHVSGWSLVNAGDFTWAADADHKLTVSLQTLVNPTTPGNDVPGEMANFDPTQSYSWAVVQWTGSYTGPTDVAELNAATVFDTSGFANPFTGTFGWSLDTATGTLSLTYTPAP